MSPRWFDSSQGYSELETRVPKTFCRCPKVILFQHRLRISQDRMTLNMSRIIWNISKVIGDFSGLGSRRQEDDRSQIGGFLGHYIHLANTLESYFQRISVETSLESTGTLIKYLGQRQDISKVIWSPCGVIWNTCGAMRNTCGVMRNTCGVI